MFFFNEQKFNDNTNSIQLIKTLSMIKIWKNVVVVIHIACFTRHPAIF